MRLITFFLLALSLLTAPLQARAEPEVREKLEVLRAQQAALIRPLLTSSDDRQVAWGATWARELSLAELEPDLLQLLRDESRDDEAVGYYGMLAVFDALIHLDARAEVEVLRPFLERRHGRGRDHSAAALVLAIRAENPHATLELFDLLDRDDKSWEEGWLALGNTLARFVPPGFAARLLQGVEIDVEITVTDPGRYGGFGRSLRSGAGDGRLPEREGYPRLWRYGLSVLLAEGDVLFADGPRPVYLRRREARRGFGSIRSTPDRPRDRIAWIARLVDAEVDEMPLKRRYGHSVVWSTPQAYVASVRGIQLRIASDFSQAVQRLQEVGHLAADEASTLVPRMNLKVKDAREDPSVPLPALPAQTR